MQKHHIEPLVTRCYFDVPMHLGLTFNEINIMLHSPGYRFVLYAVL